MARLKNVVGLAAKKKTPRIKSGNEPKNISDFVKEDGLDMDERAKKTVKALLKDSPIEEVLKEKDDILEIDETPVNDINVDWLKDQVKTLSDDNEDLRRELAKYKESGATPVNSDVEQNVVRLFLEIQNNYLKHLPTEQRTKVPTKVTLSYLLKYFIQHFPCVNKYKKI